MFPLFRKKQIPCDNCGKDLEKGKYYCLDPSYRGVYKKEKSQRLCRDCFLFIYSTYLKSYTHKAVVVEPFKPFNAYQFYPFEEMATYNWPENEIEKLRNYIKGQSDCEMCHNTAPFLLFSPDLYARDPYGNISESMQGTWLCGDCLTKKLEEIIRTEYIFYDEVWPPQDSNGFITPFEC